MNETDEPRGRARTAVRLMERGCWEGETDVRETGNDAAIREERAGR